MKKIIVIVFALLANLTFARENSLGTLNSEFFLHLDEITSDLKIICNDEITTERIKTNCFNHLLFPVMLTKWQFKNSLPLLKSFTETSTLSETEGYLVEVENLLEFNAENRDTLNKSEAIQVVSAILNIESIFMEFDRNQDNVLSYNELINIYKLYKTDFISAANLKPEQEEYSQSFFLYRIMNMIELKKIDNMKFAQFHMCVSKDYCRKEFMPEVQVNRNQITYIVSHIFKVKLIP